MIESIVTESNVVELDLFRKQNQPEEEKVSYWNPLIKPNSYHEVERHALHGNTPSYFSMIGKIVAPDSTEFVFSEHEMWFIKSMLIGNNLSGNFLREKVAEAIKHAAENNTINEAIESGKLEAKDLFLYINCMHLRLIDYDL